VILIDLDLPFGTAGLSLNVTGKQTVADALAQPDRLDENLMERFLVKVTEHLSVLTAPNLLTSFPSMDADGVDAVVSLARQMASFVVLDVPHGWASWIRGLLVGCHEVVVVSPTDLASVRNCRNIIEQVNPVRGEGSPVHLVLNRHGAYPKGELTEKDFADTVGVAPLTTIPHDPALFLRALNNGAPLVQVEGGQEIATHFSAIAAAVAHRPAPQISGGKSALGLLDTLQGLFKKKGE